MEKGVNLSRAQTDEERECPSSAFYPMGPLPGVKRCMNQAKERKGDRGDNGDPAGGSDIPASLWIPQPLGTTTFLPTPVAYNFHSTGPEKRQGELAA